jgi:hypothetical protein
MGKILVVEPRRMLQQALSLILVPDHELRFTARIPSVDDRSVTEYDVLIVDAASLREQNSLGAQEVCALQDSGVPTLWIEDSDVEFAPQPGNFVIIQRPIEKKALLSALAECLSATKTSANGEAFTQPKTSENRVKTQAEKKDSVAGGAQVIELVDVVEEEPIHRNDQPTPRKKK